MTCLNTLVQPQRWSVGPKTASARRLPFVVPGTGQLVRRMNQPTSSRCRRVVLPSGVPTVDPTACAVDLPSGPPQEALKSLNSSGTAPLCEGRQSNHHGAQGRVRYGPRAVWYAQGSRGLSTYTRLMSCMRGHSRCPCFPGLGWWDCSGLVWQRQRQNQEICALATLKLATPPVE